VGWLHCKLDAEFPKFIMHFSYLNILWKPQKDCLGAAGSVMFCEQFNLIFHFNITNFLDLSLFLSIFPQIKRHSFTPFHQRTFIRFI